MIELKHICKTFDSGGGEVEALKNVSLTIEKGEIYGIIGMSGAGKSTLVRCMNLLERPTSGEIWVDGQELEQMSAKDLRRARREITMIFQHFNLLMQRTCLRNVCFPMELSGMKKADAEKRARELLDLVGLPDKANAYPAQLSGGQQQRVAIARALATEPKVLLCDEATSALDPNTTRQILDLLKQINRELGVTIVVITHEMKVIETICNRVAVLDQSHVVEMGDVVDVFTHPQSAIARQLIMPKSDTAMKFSDTRCVRIVFDGTSSNEPIISMLTMECGAPVNILFANTRNVGGNTLGQMLLQLPEDENKALRMKQWLREHKITFKEEDVNVYNGNDQ